jgi:hypothetical protein
VDKLSELERRVLGLEAGFCGKRGKLRAVRDELKMPASTYYRVLARALEKKEAFELFPMVARRLKKQRERRRRERTARLLGLTT